MKNKFLIRWILLILSTFLMGACMAAYNKPIAKLYYNSFKADKINDTVLTFYSDVDLPKLFTRKESSGRFLFCPLENGKKIFPGEGYMMFTVLSDNETQYSFDKNRGLYLYSESVQFVDTDNAWTEISKDKVRDLLKHQTTIKCKVIAPIYLGGHYESEAMEIPVADILKAIDENPDTPSKVSTLENRNITPIPPLKVGDPCPQTGYWYCQGVSTEQGIYLRKGDPMPGQSYSKEEQTKMLWKLLKAMDT